MQDKPVFICGYPKSGTTLITQMFNNLPNTKIDIELHFAYFTLKMIHEAINSGELKANKNDPLADRLRELMRDDNRLFLNHAGDMFRNLHSASNGMRWGNNCKPTTDYLHIIKLLYPDAIIINMLRDPRDVWASVKCAKWPGLEYFSDINYFLRRYRVVYDSVQKDFVHTILYRDLIANPQCAFDLIGEEFRPEYIKGTGKVFQQRTLPARFKEEFADGIIQTRDQRYKQELPDDELVRIQGAFGDIIDRWGF